MQPTALCIESLTVFPFFCTEEIDTLKSKLPLYLSKVADLNSSIDPLQWWKHNANSVPHWAAAARTVLLVQPSSAASERGFSLLNTFTERQESALKDYLKVTIICGY